MNIDNYCKKDFEKYVDIYNDNQKIRINDWDHIEAYDWDKINNDVNDKKKNGVVICGPYFPIDKLKFNVDFHVHIKISKQKLIEARHEYIKNNPEKCKSLVEHLNTSMEAAIINKTTYPHYLDYLQKSKIDKYINANELTLDVVYDNTSNFLFNKINEFLNNYNKNIISNNTNTTNTTNSTDDSDNSDKKIDEPINYDDDEAVYLGTTDGDDYIR